MGGKKINRISDIKTLEQLKELKMRKKFEVELKRLELQSSFIRVQMNFDPDRLKETFLTETKGYFQNLAVQYLPDFLLNYFRK